MQVYLDEEPVELVGLSLAELLDAARRRLSDEGRVVVEVVIDGRSLGEKQITERAGESMQGQDVRMVSADPRGLAVQTLDQVRGRLHDADHAQQEAADLLQQDQAQPALRKVGESIEAWLHVQQAVLQSAMLLGINLDQVVVDDQPAHVLTTHSLEQLQDIKQFIQAGDMVALADALRYEWPETTATWHKLIDALIAAIRA